MKGMIANMIKRRTISIMLLLALLVGILPLPYGTVSRAATDISISELPPYPDNGQKYWVIFTEGFRDKRVEMTTCDVVGDGKDAYIVWNRNLLLHGAEAAGKYNQYYLNDEGKWEQIGRYPRFTDYAVSVIASNLDIYDSDGNKILPGMKEYGIQKEENGDVLSELTYEQYRARYYSKNVSLITEGYMTYSEIENNYTPTAYALNNMLSFGWNKRFGFSDDAQIWETILIDILLRESTNTTTIDGWEKSALEYSEAFGDFIKEKGMNNLNGVIDSGNKDQLKELAAGFDKPNLFLDKEGIKAVDMLLDAAKTIKDFAEHYSKYVMLRKIVCEDTIAFLRGMQNTENYEKIPAFHRALDTVIEGLVVDGKDLASAVLADDLPGIVIPKAINKCLGMIAKKIFPMLDTVVDFSEAGAIFLMETLCGTDELAQANVYLYIIDCIDASAKEAFRKTASDCISSNGKSSYSAVNGGLNFIIDISIYGVRVCRKWNDIISTDILTRIETGPYIDVKRPHYDMANAYLNLEHASSSQEKKAFIEKKCLEDEGYIDTVLKNQAAYANIQWYKDKFVESEIDCLLLFKVENPEATTTLYAQVVPKYTQIHFPDLEKKNGYITPTVWYTDAEYSKEAEGGVIAKENAVLYTKYIKNVLFDRIDGGGLKITSIKSPNIRSIRSKGFYVQPKKTQSAEPVIYAIPPYIEGYRVEELGDDIFGEYSGISAVSIPGTVTKISDITFYSLSDDVLYQYVKGSYAEKYITEGKYSNTEPVQELYFENESVILAAGELKHLNLLQIGSCETDDITWASTDDSIVMVDNNGCITAIKEGEAVITASSDTLNASCKVLVNAQRNSHDIFESSATPELPIVSVTPEPLATPESLDTPEPLATSEPLDTPERSISPASSMKPLATSKPQESLNGNEKDEMGEMPNQPVDYQKKVIPKKGKIVTIGAAKYIIVKSAKKNGTVAFYGMKKRNSSKVIIPDKVKIGGYVFKVTVVNSNAFKDMKKLKEVKLGKNVKMIGNNAFSGCTGLHFIILPKKVSTIGRKAFAGSGLNYLLVRSGKLKSVGKRAFWRTGRNMTVKTLKAKWRQYARRFLNKGKMSENALFIIEPVKLKYDGKNY